MNECGKYYISCKTDCMYLRAGGSGGEIYTNIIIISEEGEGGGSMEIQLGYYLTTASHPKCVPMSSNTVCANLAPS